VTNVRPVSRSFFKMWELLRELPATTGVPERPRRVTAEDRGFAQAC
jgi:hypothetical protein